MDRFQWRDLGARPAFFPAICLALGALLGLKTGLPAAVFLAGAAPFLAVSLVFSQRSGAHLSLLWAVFLIGAGLSTLQARPTVPPVLDGGAGVVRLEGVATEVAQLGDSTRVSLAVSRAPDFRPAEVRFGATLYSRGPVALLPGQRVALLAHLKPLEGVSNWGQADLAELRRRRATVFTGGFDPARLAVLSEPSAWRRWLSRTHEGLAERVRGLAPTPEAASLYLTLAAGLRATLGSGMEDAFARSGLAHILSVSGLHVAALALFTLRLLRWAAVRGWGRSHRLDARRVAAPASLPFVWAYVVFTGSQQPAVRSAVMATVFLLGLTLWRQSDALNGLALAAIAVIAVDPSCVADLSMQLSFLAVASLIVLSPAIRQAIPVDRPDPTTGTPLRFRLQRVREAALQTFCASLAVTLTGAPLIAAAFHRVSLAGLVSNVVVLPLCAALTALAASGAALFVLWQPLALPVLYVGGWASQLLVHAAELFSAVPGASPSVPSLTPFAAFLYLGGLTLFAIGRGRWRWGAVLAPGAVLTALVGPLLGPRPGLEVTFLSVGQGDSVVLSSGGAHAIIDGGGVQEGADTGERFVLPYLRDRGIRQFDLAVLSHPHPDHALGLGSTLEQVPTALLWLGAGTARGELSEWVAEAASPAPVEEVEVGRPPFALGEAWVEVLGPPVDRVLLEGVNDQSVVVRVRHGEVSFLLPGDVEEAAEQVLDPGSVTVLKAPHHGSRTSSTQSFVDRVRPRYVVFCVGRHNRFGFPHEQSVERYQASGSECYRTDLDGAIRFTSDGHDVRVETFRARALPRAKLPLALTGGGVHP